jgi:hypothetical protein
MTPEPRPPASTAAGRPLVLVDSGDYVTRGLTRDGLCVVIDALGLAADTWPEGHPRTAAAALARAMRDGLPSRDTSPLELMDSGLVSAVRLPADVRIGGRRQDFQLPVWKDESGDIRIGLPKLAPEHGADIDQIVVSLDELLIAIGGAVG